MAHKSYVKNFPVTATRSYSLFYELDKNNSIQPWKRFFFHAYAHGEYVYT